MGWLSAIMAFLKAVPAMVQFAMAVLSLVRTAWQKFQEYREEMASKEAAAILKQGAIESRSGDTSKLENWFAPGRIDEKPTAKPVDPS